MDLGLTQSQRMLKDSVREFLQRECPPSYVREMEQDPRGFTPELWRKLAGVGWLGLPFPESMGGGGGSFLDLCLLLEEMGRALLPGPFFSTVVLAGLTVLDAGSSQQQELIPKILRGELLATLAVTEASGRWDASGVQDARAGRRGQEFLLNGRKLFVENAHGADYLLVAARTQRSTTPEVGITLFLVPGHAPGISATSLKSMAADRQHEVAFDHVRLPETAVLGQVGAGWPAVRRALQRAAAAKACELVGISQRVLELTVEYVKQRVQFGRPVGSFQAVQHHCADMAVDLETARYAAYKAAWALSQGVPAAEEVATAKAWAGDAARRVCALAHQCHGAMGFTKEYDLQLYTRRARAGELLYGDPDFHREAVAATMGL